MVKSVLGVAHKGLRDWIVQRISALVMTIYTLVVTGFLLGHSGLFFAEWHALFTRPWMKVFTILFLASLVWHAWIGMWTILTDYIKPYILRSFLNLVVLFVLAICFVQGVFIVWSV